MKELKDKPMSINFVTKRRKCVGKRKRTVIGGVHELIKESLQKR